MPKRTDIHKVMIIGSGPIIIGQACEFDYSGTQACKALRSLGYEIVLVNSNPATIMTDPDIADRTYIEPLNVERLEQIIALERPDALLPNLGGQSGLNLSSELAEAGILDKYGVKVIGVQIDAIKRGEDREEFKNTMAELGIEMARSRVSHTVEEAVEIAEELGYPCVLRPAYTMGGTGGGLVYNIDELKTTVARGLAASPVTEVLVEESVLGWEELEFEVVRDAKGQLITVCTIENIDPMGVHTGDSFCAAPMQTISQEVIDRLQKKSYAIVDKVGVIGGTNVQWAHDPVSDRDIIIEINPRTSRSSALASKATGFPIALVSAMLASGLTLDEIPCGKYGTLDKYYPDGDYVVVKFARWAFEKFKGVSDHLGTQMRAVGEVMAIGKTYKEAFQKAIRSLEKNVYGLGFVKDYNEKTLDELLTLLNFATPDRQFQMYEALRKGATVEQLHELTKGGGQLLVRGESVQTGGSGLHHNGFSGEIGEGLDAGVGADNGDDAVIDVGVRPGVLFLAAGAGEAVPDAVDVSGLELGVLRCPVDRHGLIFPAEPRADLLRKREIKAVIAAVLGNVAERGELGIKADDQFAALGGGFCRGFRRSFRGGGGRIGSGGGAAAAAGQRRYEQTKGKCDGQNLFHGRSLLYLIYYGSILARYHAKVNAQKKQKERARSPLFCYFTINPPPSRRSPS